MIQLPFNTSIRIPIEVILYDGFTPLTGEAANLSCQFVSADDGTIYDESDGLFRTTPSDPNVAMTARPAPRSHVYYKNITVNSNWKRGFYRADVIHSVTGETWSQDISLGMLVERKLGVSAVYDGVDLEMGVWVEEGGEYQSDYQSITSAVLLDHTGDPVIGGGLSFTEGSNGVFHVSKTISISSGTPLIMQGTASAPRPGGTVQFKLRSEIIRP